MSKYPSTSIPSISFVTPGGNLLQPPSSIIAAIITMVPATVIADLVQPSLRSSIGSQFKAGNTPAWYATLPPAVKSYIEALATQINGGSVNLSATPTPNTTGGSLGGGNGAGTGTGTAAGGSVKTTSSKAGAPAPTRGLVVNALAAAGILGVAIVL